MRPRFRPRSWHDVAVAILLILMMLMAVRFVHRAHEIGWL